MEFPAPIVRPPLSLAVVVDEEVGYGTAATAPTPCSIKLCDLPLLIWTKELEDESPIGLGRLSDGLPNETV